MKPEQQRIKIAEACGWKEIRAEVDWLPEELTGIFTWPHPTDAEKIIYFINRKPIPDYLYDLNAMHEAEKVFNAVQRVQYMEKLGYPHNTICTFAASAQRAEAFLRTLNLWEE